MRGTRVKALRRQWIAITKRAPLKREAIKTYQSWTGRWVYRAKDEAEGERLVPKDVVPRDRDVLRALQAKHIIRPQFQTHKVKIVVYHEFRRFKRAWQRGRLSMFCRRQTQRMLRRQWWPDRPPVREPEINPELTGTVEHAYMAPAAQVMEQKIQDSVDPIMTAERAQ